MKQIEVIIEKVEDTVLAALGRSETIVLNIIEKYFGLDPQELLTDAEKKDKHVRDAGKYGVIACLFRCSKVIDSCISIGEDLCN